MHERNPCKKHSDNSMNSISDNHKRIRLKYEKTLSNCSAGPIKMSLDDKKIELFQILIKIKKVTV